MCCQQRRKNVNIRTSPKMRLRRMSDVPYTKLKDSQWIETWKNNFTHYSIRKKLITSFYLRKLIFYEFPRPVLALVITNYNILISV